MTTRWHENTPIYRQLKERIVERILEGEVKSGEVLPSVRQIASEFQLNPITVSKAYQELVDEKLVEMKRGIGMFLCEGAIENLRFSERERFIENEWPAIVKRVNRLGLNFDELLRTQLNGGI